MKGLVDKGRIADLIYEKAEYCSEEGEELLNDLIRDIDDMPAENMIEYKEGHWIKEGTTMVCDKCGNEFQIKVRGMCNLDRYDWCPCCGAYMKGGYAEYGKAPHNGLSEGIQED